MRFDLLPEQSPFILIYLIFDVSSPIKKNDPTEFIFMPKYVWLVGKSGLPSLKDTSASSFLLFLHES
jgi:hypothetical protein